MCPSLPGPVHNEQKCILHVCDGSIIISARCVPVDRNAVLTRPFFHFPGGLSQSQYNKLNKTLVRVSNMSTEN